MSNTEKPSFLTRAMQNVDKKMGRTPADGELATTESRTDVKNALIGGVVLVAVGTVAVMTALKFAAKAVVENMDGTPEDETTED
jgi:hypothetical protein